MLFLKKIWYVCSNFVQHYKKDYHKHKRKFPYWKFKVILNVNTGNKISAPKVNLITRTFSHVWFCYWIVLLMFRGKTKCTKHFSSNEIFNNPSKYSLVICQFQKNFILICKAIYWRTSRSIINILKQHSMKILNNPQLLSLKMSFDSIHFHSNDKNICMIKRILNRIAAMF